MSFTGVGWYQGKYYPKNQPMPWRVRLQYAQHELIFWLKSIKPVLCMLWYIIKQEFKPLEAGNVHVCTLKGTRYRSRVRIEWNEEAFVWRSYIWVKPTWNQLRWHHAGWCPYGIVGGWAFDMLCAVVASHWAGPFSSHLQSDKGWNPHRANAFAVKTHKPYVIHALHPHWVRLVRDNPSEKAQLARLLFAEGGPKHTELNWKAIMDQPNAIACAKEARYWRVAMIHSPHNWATYWTDALRSRSFRKSIMYMPKLAFNLVEPIRAWVVSHPPKAPFGRSKAYWCLIAALGAHWPYDTAKCEAIYELLLRTDEKALKKLAPKTQKSGELYTFFGTWLDARLPEHIPYNATLAWWSDWTKEWHRVYAHEEAVRMVGSYGEYAAMPFPLPPIPLPRHPQITLIPDVMAILEEGSRMHHCVGGYAPNAIRGTDFFFHYVHKDGGEATTQVNKEGKIVQSFGPYDHITPASKAAASILSKWAKDWPADYEPPNINFTMQREDVAFDVVDW